MKNLILKLTLFVCLFATMNGCKPKTVTPPTPPATTYYLKTANPAVKFGSLIYINSSTTPKDVAYYKEIINREYNACQTSWFPGFNVGWLGENVYELDKFNENINFMVANKITPMMHLLFGPNFYEPDWLVKNTYTNAQLETLMKNMIDKVMESNDNKNKIEVWNVINELFANDGKYRPAGKTTWDIVWNQMGYEDDQSGLTGIDKVNAKHPIFIRKAFEYCRLKTGKKLELRDYNIESNDQSNGNNFKHKGFYQLVKHMKNANIPIDAVGIQGHHEIGSIASMVSNFEIETAYKRFKDLGVEVYITELDFPSKDKVPLTEAQKLQQKSDYTNYLKQAINGGATIINTWGMYDNGEAGNWYVDQSPLLWDNNLKKKPAYDGVIKALLDTRKK